MIRILKILKENWIRYGFETMEINVSKDNLITFLDDN